MTIITEIIFCKIMDLTNTTLSLKTEMVWVQNLPCLLKLQLPEKDVAFDVAVIAFSNREHYRNENH